MHDPTSDAWERLTPTDAKELLGALTIRWWIAGGWALDRGGRSEHSDLDVAILRSEHRMLRSDLSEWDLRIAYRGTLTPWLEGEVALPANAVWARPQSADAWFIDFKIELVDGEDWVYRRDPTIRRPLSSIGDEIDGIPFFAPSIARLYRA
jgi:hypothetical protein